MPVNNYNVGRDLTFSIVVDGSSVTISGVTDYNIKPLNTEVKHKDLTGTTSYGVIPDGYSVDIKLDRADPTLDALVAALDVAYFSGKDILGGTMTETIVNKDGSTSQFQYTGCIVKPNELGNYKGDSLVPQGFTVLCSRRNQLS